MKKIIIAAVLVVVLITGGLGGFAYAQAAPDNGFPPEVSAAFVTGWTYTAPGDTFNNHQVAGNKGWASRLSPLQPSGPAIDATLSLDSDLAFDLVTPAPVTMGPPLYEWSFTNLEEGTFFWWAAVGFDEAPVTFSPGFDCSRSADQTVFSESGIQTLTIKVTPREEWISEFMVDIVAEEDDNVIPVITYEGTEFPGMPGVFITENEAVVDTEYAYTVTIEVKLKDGVSEVEFMPEVEVDIPTKVSTHGTETGSSVSCKSEGGTWKWSAAEGTYVWHWKEGIARGVTFPGYSRGIVNIPPVADNNEAEAGFNVGIATAISISPSISQASPGHVGMDVTISGTSFKPNGTITITYDAVAVATTTSDAKGNFTASFKVPESETGTHTILASDGVSDKALSFYMEGTAPPAPAPILPKPNSWVAAQPLFDWQDVTDPSGVNYTLQIAVDANFTPDTLVLEKQGLPSSEYNPTVGEKLPRSERGSPYYWRVKASDGASNESDWSVPETFYVGSAFQLPSWAIWVLAVVGGVGLFILGYRLGKWESICYL